jgi:hypothetical protein
MEPGQRESLEGCGAGEGCGYIQGAEGRLGEITELNLNQHFTVLIDFRSTRRAYKDARSAHPFFFK